ncbi:MAG: hypothetical protein ACREBU_15260 [Nitrososphaera sp.]
MKLLIRRSQKKGLVGGITFTLEARAELTPEEADNVKKYKMGKTMLYTNIEDRGKGLLGWLSRAAMGIEITVDSLVNGKQVDCKDIVEMIALEEQVKEACGNFKRVLDTAAHFEGEQVIEF